MTTENEYVITPMLEEGEFSVWKENSPNPPYVVKLTGKYNKCECADWIYRRRYTHTDCKHIKMCKERR